MPWSPWSFEHVQNSRTKVAEEVGSSQVAHGVHGIHWDLWMSCVPPLKDQGNRSASFVPSTATLPVLWSHKRAQSLQSPCKGSIKRALVNKGPGNATLKNTGNWMIALWPQQHRCNMYIFYMVNSKNENWLNTQWWNEGVSVWTSQVVVQSGSFEKCLRAQLLTTTEWIRQMTSSTLISEQYCVKDYY